MLNASYEELTSVGWQRAITLVFQGKAVIEESIDGMEIRHPHGSYPWPKTVRLVSYVRIPFTFGVVPWTKSGVMKRDKYKCIFCGKGADTVEHLLPKSRWPELSRDWENTAAACFKCNNKKGDRTLEEANMRTLFTPETPSPVRRLRGSA